MGTFDKRSVTSYHHVLHPSIIRNYGDCFLRPMRCGSHVYLQIYYRATAHLMMVFHLQIFSYNGVTKISGKDPKYAEVMLKTSEAREYTIVF